MFVEAILIFLAIVFIVVIGFCVYVMWGMSIPDDKAHIHKRNVCNYYAKKNKNRNPWGIWE